MAFAAGKLRGLPTFGHSGGGSLADVLRVPDQKLSVIVLTNEQGLLPVLSPNIASLHLPPRAALGEAGIADADPALTAVLGGVVEGLMNGTLDAAAFAPRAQQELLPVLRKFGTPESALFPPRRRMISARGPRRRPAEARLSRDLWEGYLVEVDLHPGHRGQDPRARLRVGLSARRRAA